MPWLLSFSPRNATSSTSETWWCDVYMYLGNSFMKELFPLPGIPLFFWKKEQIWLWFWYNIVAVWKDSCLSIKPSSKASTAWQCQQVTNVLFQERPGFQYFAWTFTPIVSPPKLHLPSIAVGVCYLLFSRIVALPKEWGAWGKWMTPLGEISSVSA